ncbi:hypothetical protein D0T49_12205 [Paludibacter sp. 221]|uniref:hypothetical protein n=1 Tax=Paludibacter sp. 221 TaxID=2302939 RepID=UPI0013D08B46|nr:hypothetical protein [Paludibacter sp. 221]NDV47809.1 hypothetical protein [Paludibacter sp. 221]
MKKQNLFSLLILLLICFTACDNGNEPAPDNGNDESEMKIVSRLLVEEIYVDEQYYGELNFTYDDHNRVTEISLKVTYTYNGKNTEDTENYKYSYSDKGISVTNTNYDGEITNAEVYLNSENIIDSIVNTAHNFIGQQYFETRRFTYMNRRLKDTTKKSGVAAANTYYFNWNENNMTKIYSSDEYEDVKREHGTTAEYNSTYMNKTNLDLNWFIYQDEFLYMLDNYKLGLLGYFGEKSNNLVVKTETVSWSGSNKDDYGYVFSYEFDEDGYVTKCTKDNLVIKVEYK